ncbi:MAG: Bug family tripartite tricarboxylate transporter substrate binding protein [Pseudolabrys sp.]
MKRPSAYAAAAILSGVLSVGAFAAESFPDRPIHMIVAYSPGGTGDVIARIVSEKLGERLHQAIVVENRAGASGAIGARYVAGSAPDGYTLLVGQTAEISINQNLFDNLGYDPDKDLIPIALAGVVPLALTVPASAPYSTLADFVKVIKSGKEVTFASAGTGTPGDFAGELLKLRLKGNMVHVPYKGAGPALNDLLGNHVDMYFPGFPAVMQHMKGGTLKILAASTATRVRVAPDIPTVAEVTGIKEFDFSLWAGIFAPKGTPAKIVEALNAAFNDTLKDPQIGGRLSDTGAQVTPMTTGQFSAFVHAETDKYQKIIQETGVKVK